MLDEVSMNLCSVSWIRAVVALAFVAACGGDNALQGTMVAGGTGPSAGAGTLPIAGSSGAAAGTPAAGSGTAGATTSGVAGRSGGAGATPAAAGAGGAATAGAGGATMPAAGSGGMAGTEPAATGGSSGAMAGTGGASGGAGGGAGGTVAVSDPKSCEGLPPVTDYTAPGPFNDVKMFSGVGPSSNYTLYRPTTSLGKDGFKHPVATWGNGILTSPDMYKKLLMHIASHGFVIIGCNDNQPERPCVNAGMDWLVQQNTAAGELQGKLDTTREVTIGYSWGGGAAIDTADRPNVKATFSLHGMPPRVTDAWTKMHAPLMLTTSTGDNFVTADGYVTPNYEKSTVPTFYGTLQNSMAGHLYIADEGSGICIGELLASTFGSCGDAKSEQGPAVAWLRYWACNDQGAKSYFFGDDCVMCKSPWTKPQRKNW